jgi:hypothetical protein
MLDSGFRLAECAPLFYRVKVPPVLAGSRTLHSFLMAVLLIVL